MELKKVRLASSASLPTWTAPDGPQSVYSRTISSPLSIRLPRSSSGTSITAWNIPVLSPVSLRCGGSGLNAAPPPMSPKVVPAASESHAIRSRSYTSASPQSRSKSGSIKVRITSLPTRYTDLSDRRLALLRSNTAETDVVCITPPAPAGSAYSTVIMSSCSMQWLYAPSANRAAGSAAPAVPLPPSGANVPVEGHVSPVGPSVYRRVRLSSKMPESGAVSLIGPSSRVGAMPDTTTSPPVVILPPLADSPPAVASTTADDMSPLDTVIVTGPCEASAAPCSVPLGWWRGTLALMASSVPGEMSKSGSLMRTYTVRSPFGKYAPALEKSPPCAAQCTGKSDAPGSCGSTKSDGTPKGTGYTVRSIPSEPAWPSWPWSASAEGPPSCAAAARDSTAAATARRPTTIRGGQYASFYQLAVGMMPPLFRHHRFWDASRMPLAALLSNLSLLLPHAL